MNPNRIPQKQHLDKTAPFPRNPNGIPQKQHLSSGVILRNPSVVETEIFCNLMPFPRNPIGIPQKRCVFRGSWDPMDLDIGHPKSEEHNCINVLFPRRYKGCSDVFRGGCGNNYPKSEHQKHILRYFPRRYWG
jgi:hypothetical protein